MNRAWWMVGVCCITALGLFLRAAHLERRGIIGHDEAKLLLEAHYLMEGGEDRPMMAHPLHTAVLVPASRIAGWSDTTALMVSALCGAATIPVVAGIGRLVGGEALGLVAATALGVLPFHVRYSRSGGSDVMATLFLALAMWGGLKARSSDRYPVWASLAAFSASASGLAHYRYLGPTLLLLIWIAWSEWRHSGGGAAGLRSCARVLMSGFIPFLLMLLWYSPPAHPGLGPETYLRALIPKMTYGSLHGGFSLKEPFAQIRNLLNLEGPVLMTLALAGLVVCLRSALRREPGAVGVLTWAVLPLIFWTFFTGGPHFPRCLVMGLPALALLVGYAGTRIHFPGGPWRGSWITIAVVAFMLGTGLPRAWAETQVQGGYREAARAVARDAARLGEPARLHWYYGPVWRFYMMEAARELGRRPEEVLQVVNTSSPVTFWNYAIVDPYVYHMDGQTRARLDRIMAEARPLGAWPNTWANDPVALMDMAVTPERLRQVGKRDLSSLRVYRWKD